MQVHLSNWTDSIFLYFWSHWCVILLAPIIEATGNAADADTDVLDDSHYETKYFSRDDDVCNIKR